MGLGYVGLATALGSANLGHSVLGVDTYSDKLAALSRGQVPFFEEGIEDLLKKLVSSSSVSFAQDMDTRSKEPAHCMRYRTGVDGMVKGLDSTVLFRSSY